MAYNIEVLDLNQGDRLIAQFSLEVFDISVDTTIHLKIENHNEEFFSGEEYSSKRLSFKVMKIDHYIDIMYTPKPSTLKTHNIALYVRKD